jgi:putative DNA primase/helicase
VHLIVKAKLNGSRNRKGPFGVYESARFFVMTGPHVSGTPTTINERQAELDEVLTQYLPAPPPAPRSGVAHIPVNLDDAELLGRAFVARNGRELRTLFEGSWEGRYPSQSEADLALVGGLAFWTGGDCDRIERLFRSSGLVREKWDSRRGSVSWLQISWLIQPLSRLISHQPKRR